MNSQLSRKQMKIEQEERERQLIKKIEMQNHHLSESKHRPPQLGSNDFRDQQLHGTSPLGVQPPRPLHTSTNLEFLLIKLLAQLSIKRADLAQQTWEAMRKVEDDNCLTVLGEVYLKVHDPKTPLQSYEQLIESINELSSKYGYTLQTYNLLGIILMNQGEHEKAAKIFESALEEHKVWQMEDSESQGGVLPQHQPLACVIYNLIKCHSVLNFQNFMGTEAYRGQGMQQAFLAKDQKCLDLFTILSKKINSPLAKGFFEERQEAEQMFDAALKQVQ